MADKALTNLSLVEKVKDVSPSKRSNDKNMNNKKYDNVNDDIERKEKYDVDDKLLVSNDNIIVEDEDEEEKQTTTITKKKKKKKKKGIHPRQSVKVNLSDCSYPVVYRVIKYLGWSKASSKENANWDIYWKDNGSYSVSTVREMCPQGSKRKVNHFGGMAEICLKHLLAHNMNRMKKEFPKHYTFHPKTWVLPHDKPQLKAYYQTKRTKPTFICKPSDSCQGRGIYLTKKLPEYTPPPPEMQTRPSSSSDSDSDESSHTSKKKGNYVPLQVLVVQEYIPRPYLINGYKFDLRLYCLVTQVNPHIRCFLHKEGMARFCTTEYKAPSSKNIKCSFMHLTNFAINRKNNDFVQDTGGDEEVEEKYPEGWNPHEDHPLLHAKSGSKWTLTALFEHLKMEGHDVDALWNKFKSLVAKTVLPVKQMLQHQYRASFSAREKGFGCYEVLGFDVMLDSKLRPVLIEVNHLPSFETSAKIDDLIKSRVIADALMLAGVDESTIKKRIKKKKNVIITPSKGMKNSDSMKKSSSSKVKKVEAPTLSKGRDKEKERKLMLEIENERTLYENEFRGGFERVIPLPVEVGGNPAEDVQKIRELYEELQAAKSRLHKTTHAAEKRLQEIKRKKAEREEKAARLNMIRQKHSAKVMSAASMSTAADQRRISKDGRIFQVSSRLYPGPDNSTQRTQRYNQQNNGNHPNVPYVSSRGMAPAKAVLRTSTITLLAPREMSFGGSNMPTYTYSERNGFVRSSGQSSSIKRSRNGNSSNSNSSKGDSSGFGGRTSNRFGNGGTSSNVRGGQQRAQTNPSSLGMSMYSNSMMNFDNNNNDNFGINTGNNPNYNHSNNNNNPNISVRRGSFASIYGDGGLAAMMRDNYTGPETRPQYQKQSSTGNSSLNRAWLNNGVLDQPQIYPPKMQMNFWDQHNNNKSSRS